MESIPHKPIEGKTFQNFPLLEKVTRTTRTQSRFRKIQYLLLLSVAAVLSNLLLPNSSSIFGAFKTITIVKPDVSAAAEDPADLWQDNVYPLRPQAPWDISTDFPYPRSIQYTVSEGTWLRLDVHPTSGDIIFDMIGDIWCISPGSETAHPVLVGVPYDADPHFSPEGDRFVWRSDAEHGIENIWVKAWNGGCASMSVRPELASLDATSELYGALMLKDSDKEKLDSGVKETMERKRRRLVVEGRNDARRVTNETFRYISDARFHPSGTKIVATKWYTSERSLGAGEGWEYDVPSLADLVAKREIRVGSGRRVVSRTLPFGWDASQYGDQQIGPEQLIWKGNDTIIYSKNAQDADTFQYSKDVHTGIYSIFSKSLVTNRTEELVSYYPGGATRPELSRDQRTLAFVRRVRDKEALVLKDLQTGTTHQIWYGLTYDLQVVSAPMGTYPSFAFTPSDDAVIIWAAGKIYSVPLSVNGFGEKIASTSSSPRVIPFQAKIDKPLATTVRGYVDLVGLETQDTQRINTFKELRSDETGNKVVFQAAGVSYAQVVGSKNATEVPVLQPSQPYYSPSLVSGAKDLVLHARWSNDNFTSFEIANLSSKKVFEIQNLPIGRYFSPILCSCTGSNRTIAFVKSSGDSLTGDIIATASPGLYIGEISLPASSTDTVKLTNLKFVPSDISTGDVTTLKFLDGNKKLLVQQSSTAFVIDLANGPDALGDYVRTTLASGRASTELAVAPVTAKDGYSAGTVAFVDYFHVYVAPGSAAIQDGESVWSKPGNATDGLTRLSLDGGHEITFSGDGKTLFWFLGPFLHSFDVSLLEKCSSEAKKDKLTFGIACANKLVKFQEVIVEHSTDIARLKKERASILDAEGNLAAGSDTFVIQNAIVLTMEPGTTSSDRIQNGVVVIKNGVVEEVGAAGSVSIPADAQTFDAQGGYIVPGFIDVHAHWGGFDSRYPAKSWEMETFLAHGVTTLHNPSQDTINGFSERSRIERGQFPGPRVFSTGTIIYGAGAPYHQDIYDSADARSALVRLKAEGGPGSITYKNYQLPSRASRQRLLLAARNLTMGCVPEGGMTHDWDMTFILDGMTTVEHSIPVPVLHDDIIMLLAKSGTGNTPTHIVSYGGTWGEQFVWANEDVPNDPKLRTFVPHADLQSLAESTARPIDSYQLFNTSASVAKMVQQGLRTHIGAHGEPPLGLNYHAEMWFASKGGLSNFEVLRAATSSAALTLGLDKSIGSIKKGKLADLLIYPAGVDLLDTEAGLPTRTLTHVMRGGRLWKADTMDQVYPVERKRQNGPVLNAD